MGTIAASIDLIVEATTLDQARERAGDALGTVFPGSESDGSWGNYHPCDCSCEHGASDETSLEDDTEANEEENE